MSTVKKTAWRVCHECHKGYPVFASAKRVKNKKGNFCSVECIAAQRLKVHGRDCLRCGMRYVEKSIQKRNGGFCKEECRAAFKHIQNGGEYRAVIERWLDEVNKNPNEWANKCYNAHRALRKRQRESNVGKAKIKTGEASWESIICLQMNLLRQRIANSNKDEWTKRCERASQLLKSRSQWTLLRGNN